MVWLGHYSPFGQVTVDPASTVGNNLRFAGQYNDAETGLHYNWHRYYDPITGRYLTPDPIGLDGGINLYVYAGNNPLRFVDPEGLLVEAVYVMSTGFFTVTDTDTGQQATMFAESGGKPFGDPIPPGQYDILDHREPDFLRLDPVDSRLRNDFDDASGRSHFRLHKPGNTTGCIAADNEKDWESVRDLIRKTRTKSVLDAAKPWWKIWGGFEYINYFGTLVVK